MIELLTSSPAIIGMIVAVVYFATDYFSGRNASRGVMLPLAGAAIAGLIVAGLVNLSDGVDAGTVDGRWDYFLTGVRIFGAIAIAGGVYMAFRRLRSRA